MTTRCLECTDAQCVLGDVCGRDTRERDQGVACPCCGVSVIDLVDAEGLHEKFEEACRDCVGRWSDEDAEEALAGEQRGALWLEERWA